MKTASNTTTEARVYVGTYAKYSGGSLKGEWLELDDYSDKDEFMAACAELHKDESDPEFMFRDYEGIPEGMIGESFIHEDLFEWLKLDEDDRELLAVYRAECNTDGTIDEAREAFEGKYKDEEDWAVEWMDSTGGLEGMPENLKMYFDYSAYARDCRLSGDIHFVQHEGETWAFRNF